MKFEGSILKERFKETEKDRDREITRQRKVERERTRLKESADFDYRCLSKVIKLVKCLQKDLVDFRDTFVTVT